MSRLLTLCSVLLCLLAPAALPAQIPPPPQAPAPESASVAATSDTGLVTVPQPSEKALRFYRSGNVLWIVSTLWSFFVLGAILFSGLSARIRDLARRIGRNWFFTIVVYMVIFSVLTWLVDLPLSYYASYVRPHAYDLSNQSQEKWLTDSVLGLLVSVVSLALVLWIPYLLLRKSPRRWWFYSTLIAIPLTVLALLVTPIWVDPLFNEFGPMQDKELEARILALAERAGIEGSRVYEVKKSVDTEMVNAYVSGFAGTLRIVLWDTLLEKMDDGEVLFVMGHEMGHYVLNHTWWLIGIVTALVLVSLYSVYRTAGWLIDRYHARFGFDRLSDIASYPLLALIIGVVSLLIAPVLNATTRHFEHEADRFGLEITRANRPAATAFLKLQQENLAVPYPGPIYTLWRMSHPPVGERIEFANLYRPWEAGEPLRYERLFRE